MSYRYLLTDKGEEELRRFLEERVYQLDDQLIDKLVELGYPDWELEQAWRKDLGYCPAANEFVSTGWIYGDLEVKNGRKKNVERKCS